MADAVRVGQQGRLARLGQLAGVGRLGELDGAAVRAPLPVVEPLVPLLPGGGLRPGSVVAVRGSTALLLALLAAATAQGAWAAVVGVSDLGLLAAAEAGVSLQRLALVPRPGPDPGPVVAALLDGVSLVALGGAGRLPAGARRALSARVRQHRAVLLALDRWPDPDVELTCRTESWHGAEAGHGRLRSREILVRATGRGAAARPRQTRLHLPADPGAGPPVTARAGAPGVSGVSGVPAVSDGSVTEAG